MAKIGFYYQVNRFLQGIREKEEIKFCRLLRMDFFYTYTEFRNRGINLYLCSEINKNEIKMKKQEELKELQELLNSLSNSEKQEMLEMLLEWQEQSTTDASKGIIVVRRANDRRGCSGVRANYEVLLRTSEGELLPIKFGCRPSMTLYLLILISPHGLTREEIKKNGYARYLSLYTLLFGQPQVVEERLRDNKDCVAHIIDQGMSRARASVGNSLQSLKDAGIYNIAGRGKGATLTIPLKHQLGGEVEIPAVMNSIYDN